MTIITGLEKNRIRGYSKKKDEDLWLVNNLLLLTGHYIWMWYMNREKEKGLLRFQFNKGICMSIQYKGYNSSFKIRSIVKKIAIEQQFFTYSKLNIDAWLVRSPIKKFYRNSLNFLRKKKNRLSKFKVLI